MPQPSSSPEILRYAAFTDDPGGGNPAGVVFDASGLHADEMQRIAAQVGFSETAFVVQRDAGDALDVRYFSPLAEVPFCGHATIATGVAWAERHGAGRLNLQTRSGLVELEVAPGSPPVATLTSVQPDTAPVAPDHLAEALAALGWSPEELDPAIPAGVAYAGAHHLVLAAATRQRLADLDYDFPRLAALMARTGWTTLQLVHRAGPAEFHARNPFPPGGVVEDPATGAAAAALGAHLRAHRLVEPPARITIRQGVELGRPSTLTVDIPPGLDAGISVSGTAVRMSEVPA